MKAINLKNGAFLIGIIFLLASCANQVSITKRYHGSGWYIGLGGKGTKTEKLPVKNHRKATAIAAVVPEETLTQKAELPMAQENATTSVATEEVAPMLAQKPNFVQKQLLKKAGRKISHTLAQMETAKVENRGHNASLDKKAKEVPNHQGAGETDQVLLIILAIFIPPLAVYLYEGAITTNFWIDLILTLLFWIPGVIFAFLVILDVI